MGDEIKKCSSEGCAEHGVRTLCVNAILWKGSRGRIDPPSGLPRHRSTAYRSSSVAVQTRGCLKLLMPCEVYSVFLKKQVKALKILSHSNVRIQNILFDESRHIESIQIHHLDPGGNKVAHELFLRVFACVNLCKCSQLRI